MSKFSKVVLNQSLKNLSQLMYSAPTVCEPRTANKILLPLNAQSYPCLS